MMIHVCNPSIHKEDLEFQARVGYKWSLCLKNKQASKQTTTKVRVPFAGQLFLDPVKTVDTGCCCFVLGCMLLKLLLHLLILSEWY